MNIEFIPIKLCIKHHKDQNNTISSKVAQSIKNIKTKQEFVINWIFDELNTIFNTSNNVKTRFIQGLKNMKSKMSRSRSRYTLTNSYSIKEAIP